MIFGQEWGKVYNSTATVIKSKSKKLKSLNSSGL